MGISAEPLLGAWAAKVLTIAGICMFLAQLLIVTTGKIVWLILVEGDWKEWRKQSPNEEIFKLSYEEYKLQLESLRKKAEKLAGERILLEEIFFLEYEQWAVQKVNPHTPASRVEFAEWKHCNPQIASS